MKRKKQLWKRNFNKSNCIEKTEKKHNKSTMGDLIKPFMNVKIQDTEEYKISDEVRKKIISENLVID